MNKVIWFKWITSTWNVVHSRGTWSYRWQKAGLDSSSMRSAERRDRLPQCRRRSLACAGVAWGCRPQLCSNHSLPQTWDWSATDCRCVPAPAVCEALIVTTNLKHHINKFSINISTSLAYYWLIHCYLWYILTVNLNNHRKWHPHKMFCVQNRLYVLGFKQIFRSIPGLVPCKNAQGKVTFFYIMHINSITTLNKNSGD